jgi:hypothetical protein
MWKLALLNLIFFSLGAFLGKVLASYGVSNDFNIENPKYQKWILITLGMIPIIVLFLIFIDKSNLTQQMTIFIPEIILLYLGHYTYYLIIVIAFFILGVLIFLEIFNKSTSQTKTQLFAGLFLISLLLSLILYKISPIIDKLKEPKIINNIVIQTTNFTCAPASIATLGRFTGKHPQSTEKEVTFLTNTNRLGTSTLAEIRALKKLGFNPEYRRNLTLNDLIKINKIGLLHVREKITFKLVNHAVALLSINKEKKVIQIANPLYGIQNKSYEEIKDYWYGEAIFISE